MNELLVTFTASVQGQMSKTTLGLLQGMTQANPQGFLRLIHKIEQLNLILDAKTVDLVFRSLKAQHHMKEDCIDMLREFLHEGERKHLIQTLETLCKDTHSRLIQSLEHVINHLNIYNQSGAEYQLLRLILTLLMQWHIDESLPHNAQDAAKCIKNILKLSPNSSLAQLIQLFADRISLSTLLIPGPSRFMDGFELLLLFNALGTKNSLAKVSTQNQKIIFDLHAAILSMVICQSSPYAFYDLVSLHEKHPDYAMVPIEQENRLYPCLQKFFSDSSQFKSYFKRKQYSHLSNRQTFLWSLIGKLHLLLSKETLDMVKQFFNLGQESLALEHPALWMAWFKLGQSIQINLLHAVLDHMANKDRLDSGRIRAAFMQLLAMKISPRSAFSQNNGPFQPLINTDITQLDLSNTEALCHYCLEQPFETRYQLIEEVLDLTHRYQQSLDQLPNQRVVVINTIKSPSSTAMVTRMMRENPMQRHGFFGRHAKEGLEPTPLHTSSMFHLSHRYKP